LLLHPSACEAASGGQGTDAQRWSPAEQQILPLSFILHPCRHRSPRTLTALPVYNEAANVAAVLDGALTYSQDVLVVDDGSDDGTSEVLEVRSDVRVLRHPRNLGYGAALRSAFRFATQGGYDVLVTIDCDGQHQPQLIPRFLDQIDRADIVSGSRYLRRFPGQSDPPAERQRINQVITAEVNRRLGLRLTDAFCGFKAYRVSVLDRLRLTENGYAMPLELWVQAARLGLTIVEVAVPLIYLDERRSFGGALDQADTRLQVYRDVLDRALAAPGSGS
jgi:dolichol-phosphate mannosyltransferase